MSSIEAELPDVQNALRALSSRVRWELVSILARHGEVGVGDLVATMNLPNSTLSHHLQVLRVAGVISVRAEGSRRYATLSRQSLDNLVQLITLNLGTVATDSIQVPGVDTHLMPLR
jgi:ArsR family transcriptional regulator